MSVKGNDFNFLTIENGAKICNESSQMEGCFAENVLNTDKKVKNKHSEFLKYFKFFRQYG